MKAMLGVTELAILAYWVLAGLSALNIITIPPEWMYSDYENPLVVAWNWSFFPLDVMFAVCGLLALYGPFSKTRKMSLLIISLSLMFCAGLMAISFWAIRGEFDPLWWGMNIWLMALPLLIALLRPASLVKNSISN